MLVPRGKRRLPDQVRVSICQPASGILETLVKLLDLGSG
jgi:hypothetical protein